MTSRLRSELRRAKMTQVLIIDDDRAMCKMLSGLVNQMGYKAVCEYTLEVAVTAAGPGQILFPKHLPEYVRIFATQSVIKIDRPTKGPEGRAEKINAASMPLKSLKEFRKNAAALRGLRSASLFKTNETNITNDLNAYY